MSETIHYPAERIRRLIIEGMTADAQALGVEGAEIEIQYRDDGLNEDEVLELDGDVLYFRGQAARRVTAPVGDCYHREASAGRSARDGPERRC